MANVAEARGILNSPDILFTAEEVDAAVERTTADISPQL